MRVSTHDIRRIELIPETEEEKVICREVLDGKALVYWGDAGENFSPPEYIGGLIINSHRPHPQHMVSET